MKGRSRSSLRNEVNKAKARGDLEAAVDYLEQMYEMESDDPALAKEIGSLYNKLNKTEKAIEFYWKALDQYKSSQYYQNAAAIAKMLQRLGEDRLVVEEELAFLYEKQGLIGDAVAAYEEVADLYRKENDIEGILQNLEKVVDITPKKADIRLKLIDIYENQDRYKEAVKQLKKVREIFKEQGRVDRIDEIDNRIKKYKENIKEEDEQETELKEVKKEEKVKGREKEEIITFEQETPEFTGEKEESGDEILFDDFDETAVKEKEEEEGEVEEEVEEVSQQEPEGSLFETDTGVDEREEMEEGGSLFGDIEEPEDEDVQEALSGWDDWINLAELHESIGSVDEAVEYYKKAGNSRFESGNYEKAFIIFEKISKLKPEDIKPRQRMIECATELNSRDKAAKSYVMLSETLEIKGADEESQEMLDRAKKIAPGHPMVKKAMGPGYKEEKAEELEELGTVKFDELFGGEEEGEEEEIMMEKAPSLDTLISEFKKKAEVEISGTDYKAHFDLGISYKEMGLMEDAIAEFKKAMGGHGWRYRSLEMIGDCYERMGMEKRAEQIYKTVLSSKKIDSEDKLAFAYHLGNLYADRDEFAKALNSYKRVVRIDPDFGDVKSRIRKMNKKLSGKGEEKEDTDAIGAEISDRSGDLWNSVIQGGDDSNDEEERKKEDKDKEEEKKDRISYM